MRKPSFSPLKVTMHAIFTNPNNSPVNDPSVFRVLSTASEQFVPPLLSSTRAKGPDTERFPSLPQNRLQRVIKMKPKTAVQNFDQYGVSILCARCIQKSRQRYVQKFTQNGDQNCIQNCVQFCVQFVLGVLAGRGVIKNEGKNLDTKLDTKLDTNWTHLRYILDRFWTHFGYILDTNWIQGMVRG